MGGDVDFIAFSLCFVLHHLIELMTALLINAFLRQRGLTGLLPSVCTLGCLKRRSSASRLLVSSRDPCVETSVSTSLMGENQHPSRKAARCLDVFGRKSWAHPHFDIPLKKGNAENRGIEHKETRAE